jgi:hypothetical protein
MSKQQTPPTTTNKKAPSEDSLKLIEAVLDYIRSNLSNIRNVWGTDSPQYKSASEIMNTYLDENLKKHKVEKADISDLMEKMSLDDIKR